MSVNCLVDINCHLTGKTKYKLNWFIITMKIIIVMIIIKSA